ncbi:CMRF35-like molecule 8 [Clarias gariepinus]|uniref:CMRF35-like molecule 8 n=1 Tax=Clarias gariepinus TaxID=13013 RepID=UPI00234D80F2|nr:CMRF35-like molecule 8 [Clarias gariepinus]
MCECELRMKILLLIFTLCLISDLSYKKSISETVHLGGDLNISCKYPESLRSNPKFLCKTSLKDSACSHKKYVNQSGKFSLYDDRERQILSVSIRNVTERDSGEYWCGAEAAWESDDGYEVYFTQINLTVTDTSQPGSTLKPTQPSSSSSSSSLSQPSSASSSAVSTLIPVSVILLLLLIGFIFLTLIFQKRRKMQGRATTDQCPVQNFNSDQGVPLVVCEYEEIKDTRDLSASDAGTSAVYSNVRLPTKPFNPLQPLYDTTVLPTIPCDSTIYSNDQLPTMPSDQDVYSTAQLPTGLSNEKPAEGVTYATVSFHSNTSSSNDAVPQVGEDVTSEYASVSHGTSSV